MVITATIVEAVATIKEMEEVTQVVIMKEAESQTNHYQITSQTYSLTPQKPLLICQPKKFSAKFAIDLVIVHLTATTA